MTEPAVPQQPEGLAAGVIWLVGAGVVAISAVLVVIAWLLVVPPPQRVRPASQPSPLHRELFDQADRGGELRAAGARALARYAWVDRAARVARIPIDRAIDAVVADPRLIGGASAVVGAAPAGPAGGGQ